MLRQSRKVGLAAGCFDLKEDTSGVNANCAIGGLPKDELCNGLDDDCNGLTDEYGVCAEEVMLKIRAIAPDAALVVPRSSDRIGPSLIGRTGLGPLVDCSQPVPRDPETCTDEFLDLVAPAYGVDGVYTRLVLEDARRIGRAEVRVYAQCQSDKGTSATQSARNAPVFRCADTM